MLTKNKEDCALAIMLFYWFEERVVRPISRWARIINARTLAREKQRIDVNIAIVQSWRTIFRRLFWSKNQMNHAQMTMQIIIEFKCLVTKAADMRRAKRCCKNEAFWCRHMTMRNSCNMIDRSEFIRCRAETACEDVEFEWLDLWWADWFEIACDVDLTKSEERHFVCYDVHAFSESFLCEHDKQIIDSHVSLFL